MRTIIAIIGQPASGKSTIMKAFMNRVAPWVTVEPIKLVTAEYNNGTDTYVLGKYQGQDGLFPGSDMLSMAVQPAAIQFVKDTTSNIVFEGDRLGTQSFLEFLVDQEAHIYIMNICVSDKTLKARHTGRGDNQSEIFKKGRETKVAGIRSNMNLMPYITDFQNETESDLIETVQWMWHRLIPQS